MKNLEIQKLQKEYEQYRSENKDEIIRLYGKGSDALLQDKINWLMAKKYGLLEKNKSISPKKKVLPLNIIAREVAILDSTITKDYQNNLILRDLEGEILANGTTEIKDYLENVSITSDSIYKRAMAQYLMSELEEFENSHDFPSLLEEYIRRQNEMRYRDISLGAYLDSDEDGISDKDDINPFTNFEKESEIKEDELILSDTQSTDQQKPHTHSHTHKAREIDER